MQLYRVFSLFQGSEGEERLWGPETTEPHVRMVGWEEEEEEGEWRAGLVAAAGTAAGLSRLRQVHAPVPPAAGPGGLRLVFRKLLRCSDDDTKSETEVWIILKLNRLNFHLTDPETKHKPFDSFIQIFKIKSASESEINL